MKHTTKKELQSYEYYEMLDELIKLHRQIERAIARIKNWNGELTNIEKDILAILEGEDK